MVQQRRSHNIRNMALVGSERSLSAVIGNLFAVRLSYAAQEDILDRIIKDLRHKAHQDEVLAALADAQIPYDPEAGRRRQQMKDQVIGEYVSRRSVRTDSSTSAPSA